MNDKEDYAQAFKLALRLGGKPGLAGFASGLVEAAGRCEDARGALIYCWELLKQYGDISINESDDDRWRELVDKADEFSRQGMPQRKMGAVLLAELERRAREHDLR